VSHFIIFPGGYIGVWVDGISQSLEMRTVLQRMSTQYPAGVFCAFSSPLDREEENKTLHLIWYYGGNNS